MKIAYFSPLPPQKSGIAIYNAQLLPFLAQLAEITLFADQPQESDPALQQQFTIRDIHSFAGPLAEEFDICLYQMGNNVDYHSSIYRTLCRYPGIVTLHDLNLHSFYGELLMKQGQFAAYTREMAYAYGQAGLQHARQTQFESGRYDVERFPLFDRIANLSLGLIVHSQYAKGIVARRCPTKVIEYINLHQLPPAPDTPTQAEAKIQLGCQPNELVLASFGYLAPEKRLDVVLQALAKLQTRLPLPPWRYALVGQPVGGYNIQSRLQGLGLADLVSLVGYADEGVFQTYLTAADIGINLRYPTRGETSSTLLGLMAASKPVLVSNVDSFKELPNTACVKINVGAGEQAEIEAALQRLFALESERQLIGREAFKFIRQECDPQITAEKYMAFVKRIAGE